MCCVASDIKLGPVWGTAERARKPPGCCRPTEFNLDSNEGFTFMDIAGTLLCTRVQIDRPFRNIICVDRCMDPPEPDTGHSAVDISIPSTSLTRESALSSALSGQIHQSSLHEARTRHAEYGPTEATSAEAAGVFGPAEDQGGRPRGRKEVRLLRCLRPGSRSLVDQLISAEFPPTPRAAHGSPPFTRPRCRVIGLHLRTAAAQ